MLPTGMEQTAVRQGYELWRPNREKAESKTMKAVVAFVLLIGAFRNGGSTRVRGSASRGSHLLARFFASIAPAASARREVNRYGRGS